MPNENKKDYMPAKRTGTIPKVKHRNNNNNAPVGADRHSNLVSNNLGHESDLSRHPNLRNSSRNLQYCPIMDSANNQEGGRPGVMTYVNGSCSSPIDSQPTSRKSSSGLSKCDNVIKYPDKKQIESKLMQIQEFLQVANSMKAGMRKTDEQMQCVSIQSNDDSSFDLNQLNKIISDLTDSEDKLQVILNEIEQSEQISENESDHVDAESAKPNRNELEHKVDVATRDLQMLKEHENLLLHLQLNAESQLREAKLAQARLAKSTARSNAISTSADSDWFHDADSASNSGASNSRAIDIREIEDSLNGLAIGAPNPSADQFQHQIDQLQNRIQHMRDGNDNRTQLIQILDARDAQLQEQHATLQGKLQELQNKKHQVDQLVVQLQNMHEESEEDEVGCQVKKIVNMKEQLAKLKDMLNLVENTQNSLDGVTGEQHAEIEENVNRLIAKTDNLMQQNRCLPHVENMPVSSSNERRLKDKQVNKKSMSTNEKERIKLQAELRAKRKELEDLMCKHKAANSNLNQDVSSEKNSELGAGSLFENPTTNAWFPMDSNIFNTSESEDGAEDDPNEYSEMNSSGDLNTTVSMHPPHPMPALNYPASNYIRKRTPGAVQTSSTPHVEMPHDSLLSLTSRSPTRSVHSTTPIYPPRECPANKAQLQKQLELIKSVCDSMLDAESNENREPQTVPLRVRNNLTPSPIYSEPRHYSPRPNSGNVSNGNALNIVNFPEQTGGPTPSNTSLNDTAAYNSWLTTNALQTQAFILNTLNQCCQMLWHQQKELSNLRNTVNVLQERCGPTVYHENATPLCMQSNPCLYQTNANGMPIREHPNASFMGNNFRPPAKVNHQSNPNTAASMPNLSGHCVLQRFATAPASNGATNMEHAAAACCNNLMNNNASHHHQHHPNVIGGEQQLNTNHVLHPNQNVPPSPIWNGQALNNQVAPGVRANNYWDNFRSYSRQNLFSTKSNDGSQNTQNERTNPQSERQASTTNDSAASTIGLSSFLAKSNSNHNESAAVSSPTRKSSGRRPPATTSNALNVPPTERHIKTANASGIGTSFSLPSLDSIAPHVSTSTDVTSTSGDSPRNPASRNEWNENASSKSKLFEELRENVFNEVATLITANEGRPHFLIQLFRDLQLISSDPLRRKALQSIQAIITNSLTSANSTGATRQSNGISENQHHGEPQVNESINSDYELLTVHQHDGLAAAPIPESSNNDGSENKDMLLTSLLWPMLSAHNIREEVEPTPQEPYEALSSYLNICTNDDAYMNVVDQTVKLHSPLMFDMPMASSDADERLHVLIQNGDLAEADQSRPADDEEEGAVGGLLNILERSSSSNAGQIQHVEELDLETEDESEQGLDQVPTRLSNPPTSIGCSPKSQ